MDANRKSSFHLTLYFPDCQRGRPPTGGEGVFTLVLDGEHAVIGSPHSGHPAPFLLFS